MKRQEDELPQGLVASNGVVLFDSNTAGIFRDWWMLTEWGVGVAEENLDFPDPVWDSDKRRRQDVWEQFNEGARMSSGEPVIICLLCDAVLSHPNNAAGPGNLGKHLKTARCWQSAAGRERHPVVARQQNQVRTDSCSSFLFM